jgi:hypothetical protein
MDLDEAIEVFVQGFCFTRSMTFPYLFDCIEGVWRMYDAPRTRDRRGEEFVAWGVDPVKVHEIIKHSAGGRYSLCVMRRSDEPAEPIRAGFKALGYRLMSTEKMFVHDLKQIAPAPEPYEVLRVTTDEQAGDLAKAARSRQVLPEHLRMDPPPLRQYMALDGRKPIGWVRSIVAGDATWCSNMYVMEPYRRRGIARSLMTRMLLDDREAGMRASVLLASHTGARMYPVLGYADVGELFLFTPPRES